MSYYQKIMTTFTGQKWVLLLTAAFFTLSGMAPDYSNFSGEWKLNESKSELGGQFPLCIFGGDRMRSKTMKIAVHADFKVTEVWKLINGGKSISIQVNSSSISGERTMTLVYDKQLAADYRF